MHTWRTLPAVHTSGRRPAPPTLVVIHCTEGSTAEGAARWFANPRSGGSAHVVVDDVEVWRCVDDMAIAWHARGANTNGLGLEIAGFARWTREEWMAHQPRLVEAARIHAGWCRVYSIPLQEGTSRGYHTHAGLPGNDHWDPGPGFPIDFYLQQVRRFLNVAPTPPAPKVRPHGRSLRLALPNGKTYGGWTKPEAGGFDGPALGPLRWLARRKTAKPGTVLTWRGGRFDQHDKLPAVAREILKRTGG
ncbi:N-acetylmuramoyl-L-alanine amidase [Miltoncostaea oceani]|uniref:N-acetylmuramoyl-L-alanine amidase n=1 Tax=Miltoncostaea oceani TaxID=2843216 RepID=UPI001C3E4457|nr:peptidoglycan recognition family protein [Miltoncostaea oceani]